MSTRAIPVNQEAEQGVLGCMILDPGNVVNVADVLQPEDFYREPHRQIYAAILALFSKNLPIDIISLADQLDKGSQLDAIGGYDYLNELCRRVPTTTNALHYAGMVEEQAKRRKLISLAKEIHLGAYDEPDLEDVIQKAEKAILGIHRQAASGLVMAREIAEEAINQLAERCKNPGKLDGLTTGFPDLDYKLGGLQDGDLIIVAARPSMGKTSLAENIATFVSCAKRLPVAFFSMEMKKELILSRMFSQLGRVDNTRMKKGELQEGDWQEIATALQEITTGYLAIDDTPNIKASEIRSRCRQFKHKMGDLRLVVVDHLTEMWRPCRGDDTGEHEANVRAMKRLASELNCPVILLQQLNRGVEFRADKRPVLSDLKETGAAEEVADVVMFIYRDDYYNPNTEKKNVAEILVAKGRNVGTGTVEMRWFGEYTKFANLKRESGPVVLPLPAAGSKKRRKMPDED